MSDAEQALRELLLTIAAERGYSDSDMKVQPFSTDGANYTSQLYHITISTPHKKDLNLFAKVATISEHMRNMTPFKIYETEMYFYTELLKKYQELERRNSVPEQHRLATVKYYGCSEKYMKEILVLEDLSYDDFETYDRFKTFDWEYASKSITELAKFHALSIALSEDSPEEFNALSKRFKLVLDRESFKPMIENMVRTVMTAIKEENRSKMEAFFQKSQDQEMDYYYRPLHRAVIAHGDFRPSNLMHRRRKDGQLEIVVLDYQMLNLCNPIVDLMYFIFSGSDAEFRGKHYRQLLDHYHAELSEALGRLGLDAISIYSKEDFESDLKQIQPYGLFMGMMMVPMVTVNPEDAPTMDIDDVNELVIKPNDLAISRLNGIIDDFIKLEVL